MQGLFALITMTNENQITQNPLFGILYMLAGTVLFSIADATGKWLTADYPLIQIGWLRSIGGLLIIGTFALLSGRIAQIKTSRPGQHFLRSLLSAITIFLIFYGLKYIPIAEYVALTFAAPFIIALLSPMVLREKVSVHTWVAIGLGFVGILIILRPTPDHFHLGHLASLGVAFSIAALGITARMLSTTESAIALNFYIYPLNIIVSAWFAIDTWVSPSAFDWILFSILGISATAALGCFIQSLRYAKPALVGPIDYARMIWMISLGYFIWGEIPALLSWMGIGIIIVSGIYVVSHGQTIPELEMTKETKTGAL